MNKETLQNNNTRLGTNNTNLNSILEIINNLPDEGITPTGELEIVENGTYDVTNYASANVNIEATGVAYQPKRICFTDYTFQPDEDGNDYDMSNEINGLDTSNVESFFNSFLRIDGVPKINLSTFNTSKCQDFTYMFEECSFEYVDASNFTFDSAFYVYKMFNNCYSLRTLILGEGWLNINSSMLEEDEGLVIGPTISPLLENTAISDGNGYIYVPDELVDQFKAHEVFSAYADQILPKSQLPTE